MWKKRVAAIVFFTFMVLIGRDFLYAREVLGSGKAALYLPFEYGKIVEQYKGSDKRKIICIQDIHCDTAVQESIYNIIGTVRDTYGKKFRTVGIEGTFSDIDTSMLGSISDQKIKARVVDEFMKTGDMNGADKYDIMHPGKVLLKGIEDKDLYLENFDYLYKSLVYRDSLQELLTRLETIFERYTKYLYPEELQKFLSEEEKYTKGKIGLKEYILFLKDTAKTHDIVLSLEYPMLDTFLKSSDLREKINFRSVDTEAQYVIRQIANRVTKKEYEQLKASQKNPIDYYRYLKKLLYSYNLTLGRSYQNITQYFRYLDLNEKIDEIKLLEEREHLEHRIKQRYAAKWSDANKLYTSCTYLHLLREFLWNRVSSKDVTQWRAHKEEFFERAQEMTGIMSWKNFFEEQRELMEKAEKNMEDFYDAAEKRNEVMVRNMLNAMKGDVGVVIVGGYHAEGMKEILRGKGISYDIVIPSLVGVGNGAENYMRRVKEQAKELAGEIGIGVEEKIPRAIMVVDRWAETGVDKFELVRKAVGQMIAAGADESVIQEMVGIVNSQIRDDNIIVERLEGRRYSIKIANDTKIYQYSGKELLSEEVVRKNRRVFRWDIGFAVSMVLFFVIIPIAAYFSWWILPLAIIPFMIGTRGIDVMLNTMDEKDKKRYSLVVNITIGVLAAAFFTAAFFLAVSSSLWMLFLLAIPLFMVRDVGYRIGEKKGALMMLVSAMILTIGVFAVASFSSWWVLLALVGIAFMMRDAYMMRKGVGKIATEYLAVQKIPSASFRFVRHRVSLGRQIKEMVEKKSVDDVNIEETGNGRYIIYP